jgi:hypothetical protein
MSPQGSLKTTAPLSKSKLPEQEMALARLPP